jgi:hypothetical protein
VRIVALIVAALIILAGLTFFLQGIGILPGSYMTGQAFWAFVGFFMLVIGGGIVFLTLRRRPGV